jgi:HipA-like protein
MLKAVRQLLYGYDAPPPTLKILYNGEQIAELKLEGKRYSFRYLEAFYRLALQPLPGLDPKDLRDGEAFDEMPLYFRERMPDTRRPDVKRVMQQFGIPEHNTLLLLATLGKHTVTDPFEFQLSAA